MFCPKCGRDCGNARFCRDCGTQLRQIPPTKQNAKPAYPKPPFSVRGGMFGYLKLEERSLRLNVKRLFAPRKDVTIPYDELYDAAYVPATIWLQGFLCVRGWQDRYSTIPKTVRECSTYDTIVYFDETNNDDFYRAYVFLKEIARINASRRNQ